MRKLLLLLFVIPGFIANAQDSLKGITNWEISAEKTGEGKFILHFKGLVKSGAQVYEPNQVLLDTRTTELRFLDSSIRVDGAFTVESDTLRVRSEIFEQDIVVHPKEVSWKLPISISGIVPATLQATLLYTFGDFEGFYPSTVHSFSVRLEGGVESKARIKIASIDIDNPVSPCGDEGTKDKSILAIFLLGMLGGIIALFTPCVFPMVPVTVTFFTKRSQDRRGGVFNAVLYGFFIFLIYVLITVPFHVASNTISPEIFNKISTDVTLNFIFFSVFVLFALSFFGFFEIGLPSGLANRVGSRSGAADKAGIFFMAGTLAIVSFSCTGPILGTLLTNVAVDGAWSLTAGAAGFGLALGLPFALFALFPNWLQSLPKSGGWMTNVKVVLGFVELALAVKFFSNADLVKQWGLLKREVFIGIWVIIGLCILLYLFGLIRFKHDTRVKKFSLTRVFFILVFGTATAYLVPGLTNTPAANLKLISGFPPPLCYSIYENPVNCKTGFKPLEDYEVALAKAKAENKPLLIDFTGWACVNCRKMEESVWTDPTVDSLMHKEFVVVSLYVDERRKLPLAEQTVVDTKTENQKSIVTVGDKWSTFQTENFGATSQPQYAILSPGEQALTKSKFYTPDPGNFADWLICGLESFRSLKK
jgi:thiol:disulfide interchange protein DsbD